MIPLKYMHSFLWLAFFVLAQVTATSGASERADLSGTIRGRIVDAVTQAPVNGASVMIAGTAIGTAADNNGKFVIENIPAGSFTIAVTSIAYHSQSIPDITVRSGKITYVNVALYYRPIEMRGTSVRAGYFSERQIRKTGRFELSPQEIRRAPGAAGDISRIIDIHPGVSRVDDEVNSLVVRGGSPTENGFYVDNIEIPNINHFPENASSGGGFPLFRPDFIQNVSFSAGGFSAAYGDKLSSVTDITLREGNREKYEARLDLNFAGAGIAAEGPLQRGRASWLFSARRSYLEFLSEHMDIEYESGFSDFVGKLVYDISSRSRLSILGVIGHNHFDMSRDRSKEIGRTDYGTMRTKQFTAGINWQYLYGSRGNSNTSLALIGADDTRKFLYVNFDRIRWSYDIHKYSLQLRHLSVYRLGESGHLEWGIEGKLSRGDYDIFSVPLMNPLGGGYPGGTYKTEIRSGSMSIFASHSFRPVTRLTTTFGLRYDYYERDSSRHMSPRFAFTFQIFNNTFINGATGIYYQCLPLGMFGSDESDPPLKDPVARHFVLGISRLMSETTRLTVEGYLKNYSNFPLDARQPALFIIDGLIYVDYLGYCRYLIDSGKARSYGIEFTLQKKLVRGIYGIICASYSRSKYLGLDNIWRDRIIDHRFTCGIEGGYRPNDKWQFGLKWMFAEGSPHTPLDLEKSQAANRDVYDIFRINEERYPDYHILNLRIERRYQFMRSNLSVFLEIYNIYNRENVYRYYWNEKERKQDVLNQYGFLPIFGLEFEI